MNIKIIPKPLKGSINAISSKSHAHRLMIAASLCSDFCKVSISDMNQDLEATQTCLLQLNELAPIFDCNESGSTLRFMLPISMALKDEATFLGSGRLPERPISPLKEEMESHGCTFDTFDTNVEFPLKNNKKSKPIFTVKGRLKGGTFNLAGNVSSQYITGLLFALPLLKEDSLINITSNLESLGYVMLTLEVLKLFGINIESRISENTQMENEHSYSFFIKGNQNYISPGEVTAEGDWSNAAFWIVADSLCSGPNCLGSAVSCRNLNFNSAQGDKEIVSFAETIKAAENSDKSLIFDVSNVPDLVPILAVLAASRKGITEIINAGRLRIKESDRLATVCEIIQALGGNITELPEGLIINGTGVLKGGTINGHNDHRIVMAAAIASILCTEPVTILGAESVNKSYPRFFADFSHLGGDYHVL